MDICLKTTCRWNKIPLRDSETGHIKSACSVRISAPLPVNSPLKPAFRNECQRRWGALLLKPCQNSHICSVQRKHTLKDFIIVVHLTMIKLFLKSYIFTIKTQRTRTYVDIIQNQVYNVDKHILFCVVIFIFKN